MFNDFYLKKWSMVMVFDTILPSTRCLCMNSSCLSWIVLCKMFLGNKVINHLLFLIFMMFIETDNIVKGSHHEQKIKDKHFMLEEFVSKNSPRKCV